MHSPMKFVYYLIVFLAALGSIHLGLLASGYDILAMANISHLSKALYTTFGVCGVLTVIMLFMHCSGHCHAGSCNSSCGCK